MRTTRCRMFARFAAALVLLAMAPSGPSLAAADEPGAVGPCAIPETSVALVSQLMGNLRSFGSAVAIDGDWIAVGVPGSAGDAGRVELFHRVDGGWGSHSVVVPANSAIDDRFGSALSMAGDLLLVGAPSGTGVQPTSGSAHLFRRLDGRWVEEALLIASDGGKGDFFGWDVALDGELALVGAFAHAALGNHSGAAYLFTSDSGRWSLATKLMAPDGMPGDRFGFSVEASGGRLAIGASSDAVDEVSSAGSVRIFEYLDDQWIQTNLISPVGSSYPDAAGFFGAQITLRGDTLLAGATIGFPHTFPGIALAYTRDGPGRGWGSPRLAVAPDCFNYSQRTLSLGLDGNSAYWLGVSGSQLAATILQRDVAGWTTERRVTFSPSPSGGGWEGAVAVSATDFVVGRPQVLGPGFAFVAQIPPRDRDLDGRDDACEIASGLAEDCDGDGIFDDVQVPFRYASDAAASSLGSLYWNGGGPDGHVLYLNHFVVSGSSGTLRAFGLVKPEGVALPTAQTALVYLDPDGDGDPSDAVLLHAQVVTTGAVEVGDVETIPVGPVTIGPEGTSFFVGMTMASPGGQPFAPVDDEWPHRPTSWFVAQSGPPNLVDLSRNMPTPLEIAAAGSAAWIIRLRADLSDCDDSTRLDVCEIAEGVLEDLDGDGVPDVCTPPFGDLDGDGAIGPGDVATLFMHWGPCVDGGGPCLADLNQDGTVDGADLALVLAEW